MPKAVIYTRVSTEEQVTNYSLEFQDDLCRKYAKDHKLQVVKIFREEGASAKTINGRPVLLELLKYCQNKKNKISTLLIYKYDRLSRNTEDGLGLLSILGKLGIDVISITEPSQNSAMGKAMRSIMLVMAQLDNDTKSERTTNGMKAAFKAGRWPWKAPIGYKHVVIENKKKLILIEGFKKILPSFFDEAATGLYSRSDLAEMLNKKGYSDLWGSPANEKTVDKILKKKFYFGVMEAKKWDEERVGVHEIVTDEVTWLRAYSVVYKGRLTFKSNSYAVEFPLRRFALCGGCLKPLTASYSRGNGGKYAYYHCHHKSCSKPVRIRKEKFEKEFLDYIGRFTLSELQRKLLEGVLREKLTKKVREQKREIKRLSLKLAGLDSERLSVLKSIEKSLVNEEEAKRLLDDIRTREAVAKVELSENRIDYAEADTIVSFISHFASNVSSLWERLDFVRKCKFQEIVFPSGVIFKDGTFRTTKISPSFELIQSFAESEERVVTPRGIEPRFRG